MTVEAVVALGANLGDTVGTLRRAIADLETVGRVTAVSHLWETEPVGGPDQPRFHNAVAAVETVVDADAFLAGLHRIEAAHGRVREVRWGPRTLDLDLILHGDTVSDGPAILPHPRAAERAFVLAPLVDVRPDARFPDGTRAADLLASLAPDTRAGLHSLAADGWWNRAIPTPPMRVVIVGHGRAGRSLTSAIRRAGHTVVGIVSRRASLDDPAPVFAHGAALPDADLVILAVPDAAIAATAADLTAPPGSVVAHLSGITPTRTLVGAGEFVGGMHPLTPLTGTLPATGLAGVGFGIGGDATARRTLGRLAESLGGWTFPLPDTERALHHTAAAMAANHVTAVLGVVAELTGDHFSRYEGLATAAVASSFRMGPAAALTGPVARGDTATVELHRATVAAARPDLLALFDSLVAATRHLAEPGRG